MQILEPVGVPEVSDEWECPFEHKEGMKHDKKNVIPKHNGENDAGKLADNIDANTKGKKSSRAFSAHGVSYHLSAHHILPGNESWNKDNALKKWIDKKAKGSKVVGDIGYDVNDHHNGVYLGSGVLYAAHSADMTKEEYTSLYMGQHKRQYHDRHEPYSDFVVNCFIKIAEGLGERVKTGCEKAHCGGKEKDAKKSAPPYTVLKRLHALAKRLEGYLTTSKWRLPVVTSKYVVMYKDDVDAGTALDKLRKLQVKLRKERPGAR